MSAVRPESNNSPALTELGSPEVDGNNVVSVSPSNCTSGIDNNRIQ